MRVVSFRFSGALARERPGEGARRSFSGAGDNRLLSAARFRTHRSPDASVGLNLYGGGWNVGM